MQYDGPDHQQLDRTLAGFARHPNVGRVHPRRPRLRDRPGLAPHRARAPRLIQLNGAAKNADGASAIQECGGIGKTVEAGVKAVAELLPRVNDVRRTTIAREAPHPRHQLRRLRRQQRRDRQSRLWASLATCIVQQGGTSILGETPEIYGAEHLLTRRAVSRRKSARSSSSGSSGGNGTPGIFGAEINNNPSPATRKAG